MRYLFLVFCAFMFTSCGKPAEMYDEYHYRSITNKTGTVIVKIGNEAYTYPRATIVYSNSDASTMLIESKEGKRVYIQGPALVEFDDF